MSPTWEAKPLLESKKTVAQTTTPPYSSDLSIPPFTEGLATLTVAGTCFLLPAPDAARVAECTPGPDPRDHYKRREFSSVPPLLRARPWCHCLDTCHTRRFRASHPQRVGNFDDTVFLAWWHRTLPLPITENAHPEITQGITRNTGVLSALVLLRARSGCH